MNAHALIDGHSSFGLAPTARLPRQISEETREKMRAAARARVRPPETAAAISEGLRQWHAQPESKLRGFARVMTDGEWEDYRVLRNKGRYSVREALVMVGRRDLLNYRPTPMPPRRLYCQLSPDERRAYWLVWNDAESWQHAMDLIGRADVLR